MLKRVLQGGVREQARAPHTLSDGNGRASHPRSVSPLTSLPCRSPTSPSKPWGAPHRGNTSHRTQASGGATHPVP